ncbi:uncharacterized protein F4812DRAFT_443399 [Daldinia caldariorum]|uniref:uncharacterized protein n=1 Tax=Daldinia caldariorum TaxID=326644 RepID=UPI002008C7C6|nr:uncharacterized protein F4812DRAFT_443399 [Daldinia caldariorum]KAI1464435.1 hypothetical protein F4812DRAFT_443399 [Daldinia caldariorum]
MAKPERVLRLSGSYHRKDGVSEEEFHRFSRHHAVACAKIHQKYGILKYQIAYSSSSAQELAKSMKTPYKVNDHDLEIEYYFKDVATLLAVSADQEFKDLHLESEPYVRHDTATVTLTWIEVYLEDGKVVNVSPEGESLFPSFAELSDIKITEESVAKYYEQ